MSYFNDTLVYQSLPYDYGYGYTGYYRNSDCKALFECPIGHDLVYNITKFDVETTDNCERNSLGNLCINTQINVN